MKTSETFHGKNKGDPPQNGQLVRTFTWYLGDLDSSAWPKSGREQIETWVSQIPAEWSNHCAIWYPKAGFALVLTRNSILDLKHLSVGTDTFSETFSVSIKSAFSDEKKLSRKIPNQLNCQYSNSQWKVTMLPQHHCRCL